MRSFLLVSSIHMMADSGARGSAAQIRSALEKLNSRRSYIQKQVMKRVVLKYTPVLEFRTDDSIERGVKLVDLLDEIEAAGPSEEPAD